MEAAKVMAKFILAATALVVIVVVAWEVGFWFGYNVLYPAISGG